MTIQERTTDRHRPITKLALPVFLAVTLLSVATVAAGAVQPAEQGLTSAPDTHSSPLVEPQNASEPIEEAYRESVPEEGDPYFEAAAADGSWVSYVNPRDEYRNPYLGDGSGKLCVALFNERGEPVVGESVPNTTVTIPTGESIEWHTHADPLTIEYPLTETSVRPLDADQFGTDDDLPQGDGYLDAHCIEVHGLPEDGAVEYGAVEVDGEYADWIEPVGYVQVEGEAWDSSVDPLEDAVPYEDAGGWSYEPNASHGQVVAVLQLDPPAEAYVDSPDDKSDDPSDSDSTTEPDRSGDDAEANATESTGEADDGDEVDRTADTESEEESESLPGFGVPMALTALVLGGLLGRRA